MSLASRFCLAGIGGRVEAHLRKTRQASRVLAIDGCRVGCARRALDCAGFEHYDALCVGDLGIEKGKASINDQNIERVFEHAREILIRASSPCSDDADAQNQRTDSPDRANLREDAQ